MGGFGSKNAKNQVLLTGPSGSGKTSLLYSQKLESTMVKVNPTVGFQYEEIQFDVRKKGKKEPEIATAGFWDIGGNEACMAVMQAVTQNIKFNALVFVVDITDDIMSRYGGIRYKEKGGNKKLSYRNNIDETRILIHKLMAEEETRSVHTLVIVFNCKQGSKLYKEIFPTDPNEIKSSLYLKKLEEERKEEDKKDPEEEAINALSAKPKNMKNSVKYSSIHQKAEESEHSFKESFLQRMKFSREVLDLGEVIAGMTDTLEVPNPQHEMVITEVFDVLKDTDAREALFRKLVE